MPENMFGTGQQQNKSASTVRRKMSSLSLPQLRMPGRGSGESTASNSSSTCSLNIVSNVDDSNVGVPASSASSPWPRKVIFWKKRSVTISDLDPEYRVTYLGNVLTGWAKGDGCVDKPLATLWRNHTTSEKPNIVMKVTVCASGLKAITKEHGLTEYWANRITYCTADPNYPKVFCWIYRHEGRKLKQELRCHAVLCPSESKAKLMAKRLQERLHQALIDFKKEKISKQNARLSLANTIYDNPTMPYRKILLHTGSSNYRPPPDRGKSAPKLKVIEEVIVEEDEEDDDSPGESPSFLLRRTASEREPSDGAKSHSHASVRRSVSTPMYESESEPETTMTSVATSVAGIDVGDLGEVSDEYLLSFEPHNAEDGLRAKARLSIPPPPPAPAAAVNEHLILARFDEDLEEGSGLHDSSEDEEADIITSYIPPSTAATALAEVHADPMVVAADSNPAKNLVLNHDLEIEIDSAASVSPDSNQFSTRSSSERRSLGANPNPVRDADDDSLGDEELGGLRISSSEQDAISDESGYSEESALLMSSRAARRQAPQPEQLLSGATTFVNLNNSTRDELDQRDSSCDRLVRENDESTKSTEFREQSPSSSSSPPVPKPRTTLPAEKKHAATSTAAAVAAQSNKPPLAEKPKHIVRQTSPPSCSPSKAKTLDDEVSHVDMTVHSGIISDLAHLELLQKRASSSSPTTTARSKLSAGPAASEAAKATPAAAGPPTPDFLQNRIAEFCINI